MVTAGPLISLSLVFFANDTLYDSLLVYFSKVYS
jgi:hypothetical protein